MNCQRCNSSNVDSVSAPMYKEMFVTISYSDPPPFDSPIQHHAPVQRLFSNFVWDGVGEMIENGLGDKVSMCMDAEVCRRNKEMFDSANIPNVTWTEEPTGYTMCSPGEVVRASDIVKFRYCKNCGQVQGKFPSHSLGQE